MVRHILHGRVVASLCLLLHAGTAEAGRLAVLEFEGDDLKPKALGYLRRKVRGEALRHLPAGWEVMTRENMLVLIDSSAGQCLTEGACEVETGRNIGADLVVAGEALRFGGELRLSLTLYDTKSGRLLRTAETAGRNERKLAEGLPEACRALFAGVLGGRPPPAVGGQGPRITSGEVTASRGNLIVECKPFGLVRLDLSAPGGESLVSGSPYRNQQAPVGRWQLLARAQGHAEQRRSFDVPPDETTLVKLELAPLGALEVRGSPRGAAVEVIGPGEFRHQGGLPWSASGLPSGLYGVRVSRPGYTPVARKVEVAAGGTATVEVELTRRGAAAQDRPPPAASGTNPRRGETDGGGDTIGTLLAVGALVGQATAGVGVALALSGQEAADTTDRPQEIDDANGQIDLGNVFWVGGIVLGLASGGALLGLSARTAAAASPGPATVEVRPAAGGAVLGGTF